MLALPGNYEDMSIPQALQLILKSNTNQHGHREQFGLIKILLSEAQQSPELLKIARQHGADPARTRWPSGSPNNTNAVASPLTILTPPRVCCWI